MIPIFIIFSKLRKILKKNFFRVTALLIAFIIYATFSEFYIERSAPGSGVKSLFDSFWFVMQTITTVGYGDTPVVTFWGRINAVLIMVVGIGLLGFFTASFASIMIEADLSKKYGEKKIKMKEHIIVCNWNAIAEELVKELVIENEEPVVILANLEKSPVDGVNFVKGSCLKLSDLEKAGIKSAKSAVVLAETIIDGNMAAAIDARSLLGVMNIKKSNNNCHTVVELLTAESVEPASTAGADEYVVRGEISAKLLSRSILDPGTGEVFEKILTARSGQEVLEDPLPSFLHGKKYEEAVQYLLKKHAIAIALRGNKGLRINPDFDEIIDHDSIIYISSEHVKF